MTTPGPVRVAIVNDYEVVVHGLAAMLAPYRDRVRVVEVDVDGHVASEVDVTLMDTFAQQPITDSHLEQVLSSPRAGKVVVFTWNMQPELVDLALAKGARGYLDKSTHAEQLVEALEKVAGGDVVVSPSFGPGTDTDLEPADTQGDWPGRAHGLSPREAEVLALITQGLTNTDIARRTYLSINSVKTYIRNAYRKIGVTRRSQAVRWGLENSMTPGSERTRTPRGQAGT
ncbi:response regulator transcription factor [Ornithinimicrobium pekingense]|uniref:response regulator transcription factor n=1 Tax=Ornithinimicrobium pekingense TaxID=384677 RepID=UPI0004926CDB|nr:response regulator transcription factor [Ornithinimicrobium pekingense]